MAVLSTTANSIANKCINTVVSQEHNKLLLLLLLLLLLFEDLACYIVSKLEWYLNLLLQFVINCSKFLTAEAVQVKEPEGAEETSRSSNKCWTSVLHMMCCETFIYWRTSNDFSCVKGFYGMFLYSKTIYAHSKMWCACAYYNGMCMCITK